MASRIANPQIIGPEPAWVLHRRSFGDSGFIVDLLALESGRFSVVAKGVKRRGRGGSGDALLQPFGPLQVSSSGRSDLRTLRSFEAAGPPLTLKGINLFGGFYVNELLVKLWPNYDPNALLFASYGATVMALAEGKFTALRRFELELLKELGYSITLEFDRDGVPVDPTAQYQFLPQEGLLRLSEWEVEAASSVVLNGAELQSAAQIIRPWLECDLHDLPELAAPQARLLKRLCRQAIDTLLSGRELRSRELLRHFLRAKPV